MARAARKREWHFTVRGSWPFPDDMIRRDTCRAAEPEDQSVLDRMSSDEHPGPPSTENPRVQEVTLVAPSFPTIERWRSFGWPVVTEPALLFAAEPPSAPPPPEPLRSEKPTDEQLVDSARGKLTTAEWEAMWRVLRQEPAGQPTSAYHESVRRPRA